MDTSMGCCYCYFKNILKELSQEQKEVLIHIDNIGAELVAQAAQTKRSKHYDVRYHYVKEKVTNGEYILEHISTQENVADIFTKGMSLQVLERDTRIILSILLGIFRRSYFMEGRCGVKLR